MRRLTLVTSALALLGSSALAATPPPPSPLLSDGTTIQSSVTGGAARTLAAHFSDRLNVKDFAGVLSDGLNDDTAGVQAAYAAAATACATKPVALDFPPGRYSLSSAWKPTVSCAYPIAIVGAGPGMTSIVVTGADGFDITLSSPAAFADVVGMQVLRAKGSSTLFANTAVSITAPGNRAEVSHLEISDSSGTNATGWATGVALVETSNALIDDTRVQMPVAPAGTTAGVGYSVSGTSSAFAPDNHLTDDVATGGWAGLSIPGFAQGVYVSHPVFVGNVYGIDWNGAQAGDYAELLVASGGEFNDSAAGIYVAKGSLSQIVDNHFFRFQPTTSGSWDAIDLEGGNNYVVSGNNIYGANEGTEVGIMADNLGSTPNAITANVIGAIAGYGISLSGSTVDAITSGNSMNGTGGAVYEANTGRNLLGPVVWNGNVPVRYDGAHFDLLNGAWFPLTTGGSAIVEGDNAGNISIINTVNGAGGLITQGQIIAGTNILTGSGHSLVTVDATGTNQGYLSAMTTGGVQVSTLQAGRNAQVQITPGNGSGVPACSAAIEGTRASVTDATSSTFGAAYAPNGGGSLHEPVYCNGTSWLVE